MSIQCIDVDEYQGNVDWSIVKAAGVQFAMIRAGYGTGTIDVQFRNNARGCGEAGIPFGVYWLSYAYAPEMARREAEYCIETIEEYKVSYPVCIAFTYDSMRYVKSQGVAVTKELTTSIVEAFCGRIKELGYSSMCYKISFFLPKE